MINVGIGIACLGLFIVLLMLVRARDGEPRIRSVWAAQSVALVLVCVLMVAGGFLFKALVD